MPNTAEVTKKQSLKYIMDFDKGEQVDIDLFIRRETRLVIQDRNKMRHRYKTNLGSYALCVAPLFYRFPALIEPSTFDICRRRKIEVAR